MNVRKNYLITGVLFILFAVFTVLVTKVDVKPIGLEGTEIGFAGINEAVRDSLSYNEMWYTITKITGMIAILVAALFGLLGLAQLIRRKSFAQVDKDIYALAITYVLVIAFYVLFEKMAINFRPVDLGDVLEASFPSTHSMLVLSIMGTAMIQFHRRLKDSRIRMAAEIISALLIVITVVGRLLSGVHWFTDIIGGIILGTAFIMLYYSMECSVRKMRK